MLPTFYLQAYQNLLALLEVLQELVVNTQVIEAHQTFEQLGQVISIQILPLTGEELEDSLEVKWRSIQTELYRTWRLLETDWLFLSSARQITTKQARSSIFLSRLDKMIDYCHSILDFGCPPF